MVTIHSVTLKFLSIFVTSLFGVALRRRPLCTRLTACTQRSLFCVQLGGPLLFQENRLVVLICVLQGAAVQSQSQMIIRCVSVIIYYRMETSNTLYGRHGNSELVSYWLEINNLSDLKCLIKALFILRLIRWWAGGLVLKRIRGQLVRGQGPAAGGDKDKLLVINITADKKLWHKHETFTELVTDHMIIMITLLILSQINNNNFEQNQIHKTSD